MKTLILALSFFSTTTFAADLHVKVIGLRDTKGDLAISVFDQNGYPKTALEIDGRKVTMTVPASGNAEVVFELPPGDYAVGVIHDKNRDGKLNTFLGGKKTPPVEGGSFTRGIGFMGPNKWEDSKVSLPNEGLSVELKMRYWL